MDINEFRRRYNVKGMDEAIIKTELDYTIENAQERASKRMLRQIRIKPTILTFIL